MMSSSKPIQTETHVAERLPATAVLPEPAQHVGLLRGLFCYWLMPGRLGPHLAVGSSWKALAAHLLTVGGLILIGLGIYLVCYFAYGRDWVLGGPPGMWIVSDDAPAASAPITLESVRVALADGLLEIAAESNAGGWDWVLAVGLIFFVPLLQVPIFLLAVLFMPWAAGGDRAGSVFRRSLKNVYWALTLAIPIALIWTLGVMRVDPLFNAARFDDIWQLAIQLLVMTVVFVLPVIWLLRALIVGAKRYVGEPDGPTFAPREPRCDQCGYLIVGLPYDAACPECGLRVRDSLPGGRRQPTVWQQHEFRPKGFVALIRDQYRVWFDRSFFETLPVQDGLAAARHFWWGTYLLMLVGSLGFTAAYLWIDTSEFVDAGLQPLVAICVIVLPFLLQALLMFSACLWGQWRLGILDYRVSAVACYYGSPYMWPAIVTGVVSSLILFGRELENYVRHWDRIRIGQWSISADGMMAVGCLLVIVLLLLIWWVRLLRALHAVRYANV